MLLLLIFSLLLLFSVFEICNAKAIEFRNYEEDKINKILQNYLQPLKQLTDNLPNHEVEIQLEFERPNDEKYAPQPPGRDYQKNNHQKHKNKASYVILKKPANQKHQKHVSYHRPDNQKYAQYEAPRNEYHKHSPYIDYPRTEYKKHSSHQDYERLDYPRPNFQKPLPSNYELPREEYPKALPLASNNEYSLPEPDYQRPLELPPSHDHPKSNYHHQPNNEYSRLDYQKPSDMTRYFEFQTPGHRKHSAMNVEYQRPDYPKRLDLELQRQERDYQRYAPVQPYFEFQSNHDRHKYPSLSPQGKVVYVPYNDNRYLSMRRTNDEIGLKSVPQQVILRINENPTAVASVASSTLTEAQASSNASPSTASSSATSSSVASSTQASSKSPVYMEDLRDLLNEFVNKLQSTTGAPQPTVVMTNDGSLHGNLEDIVQLIKQGLHVAKRINVPNADQLEWLQIKLPKNIH